MDRYMIVTPHTDEECLKLLDWIQAQGYLHHFDWGCKSGEHCGWAILEVDSEHQALLAVPPLLRGKAHAFKLSKYKDEDLVSLHASGG